MEETEAWLAAAASALGIDGEMAVNDLLALTRDVAHQVTRPAAPLTTYLVGVAVAGGLPLAEASAAVSRCLASWEAKPES